MAVKYLIERRRRGTQDFWEAALPEPVTGQQLPEELRKAQARYGAAFEFQHRAVEDCPGVVAGGFCGVPRKRKGA
jgi:hypothetical protein